MEFYSLIRFHQLRPSHESGRVGSCINGFGACSAFTHVTACTLAKSPSDPLHQRLQQSRCLHCCSDCYRVERTSSRAGYSRCGPAPFTAHPISAFRDWWTIVVVGPAETNAVVGNQQRTRIPTACARHRAFAFSKFRREASIEGML